MHLVLELLLLLNEESIAFHSEHIISLRSQFDSLKVVLTIRIMPPHSRTQDAKGASEKKKNEIFKLKTSKLSEYCWIGTNKSKMCLCLKSCSMYVGSGSGSFLPAHTQLNKIPEIEQTNREKYNFFYFVFVCCELWVMWRSGVIVIVRVQQYIRMHFNFEETQLFISDRRTRHSICVYTFTVEHLSIVCARLILTYAVTIPHKLS